MQKLLIILFFIPFLSVAGAGKTDPSPTNGQSGFIPKKSHMAPQLIGAWRDRWSLSSSSLIYTDLYNSEKEIWYGGKKSPWDMDPDPANGVYFDEKGNFVWVVLSSTRPYSGSACWVHAVEFISGTASVTGNKITFYPTVRRQKYTSVCSPGKNYDRDIQKDSFEVEFNVTTLAEADGTQVKVIRLTNPDHTFIEYYAY
jgi:hypothetical protein